MTDLSDWGVAWRAVAAGWVGVLMLAGSLDLAGTSVAWASVLVSMVMGPTIAALSVALMLWTVPRGRG